MKMAYRNLTTGECLLREVREESFFSLKLRYEGEKLAESVLNGKLLMRPGIPYESEFDSVEAVHTALQNAYDPN